MSSLGEAAEVSICIIQIPKTTSTYTLTGSYPIVIKGSLDEKLPSYELLKTLKIQ